MTTRRPGAILLPLAAAVALLLAACGGEDASESAGSEAAALILSAEDVVTVAERTVDAGTVITGTLDPHRVVEVRAQVPGVLTDLRVDRGSAVRAGQPLAQIEAEGIRGQAASARAAVASAEANLALARRQFDSAERLHGAGALSDIELEQARAGLEAAHAQLAAAQAQALGAGESARRATVVAPLSGEVSQRMVSQGEAVTPGQALLTIVDAEILELQGQVPVSEAAGIRPGQPVAFSLEAYPGRDFRGTVARVDPTADPGTRQVGVYVRLPNTGRALVGGLFATGRILTGGETVTVVVPVDALRTEAGANFVWAIREGRAVRVPVEVGVRDEAAGIVEIRAGLEVGERVVAAPGELTEGARVEVQDAPPIVSGEER